MKILKYIFSVCLFLLFVCGCAEDENLDYLDTITAPSNISALIKVAQDNSGLVTVTPNGDGAVSFDIYYGDGTVEPENIKQGESVTHTYVEEGTYNVRVVGNGITGLTNETTQEVFVSVDTEIFQPMVAAPRPPDRAAQDVISMFSDVYTDVPVDTWRTPWSEVTFEDVEIEGNPTKKYNALNFVGIEAATTTIDVSTMTHFHMDIWSPNLTEFKIKLVDFGADNAFGGGDDVEHEIIVSNPTNGEWVSLDIPLTDFSGLTTRSNIAQLVYAGVPSGIGIVFVDNIYFYYTLQTETIGFPINFESSNLTYTWSGFGAANFGVIPASVVANPDQSGINNSATVIEIQKTLGAQVWAGATLLLSRPVDFTNGTTVTMKVWSPRAGVPILFKMEDTTSPRDANGNLTVFVEVQATTTVANAWEELSFDLTSYATFSTSTTYTNVNIFPDFGNAGAGETFYFDDFILTN